MSENNYNLAEKNFNNKINLSDEQYEELKNIVMYALERNYGVYYTNVVTTIQLIDTLFTKIDADDIKKEFIVS